MQTDPQRGLGRSPNGGLGGQSPPTAKPSNNFILCLNLRSRCNYCFARFMCMLHLYEILNVHTHQYLLFMYFDIHERDWTHEIMKLTEAAHLSLSHV